ncbi:MAG: DUF3023 domain-containing protein [Ehrlichia sp.]
MLNFSLEDHKKYNKVLCRNIGSGDLTVHSACCIGNSEGPEGKLKIYLDAGNGYVVHPAGRESVFIMEISVKKEEALCDPILAESKEYQSSTSGKQSSIMLEVYAVVHCSCLENFEKNILRNLCRNKHVNYTNLSKICSVKFAKPKTYADANITLDLEEALSEVGGLNSCNADFLRLCKPQSMVAETCLSPGLLRDEVSREIAYTAAHSHSV